MSATKSLTRFYGSFFLKCGEVAIYPYLLTMGAFIDSKPKEEELILGIGVCLFLSTVVPILPAITSITFAIASFGISLALASMFVTYPVALISDALDSTPSEHYMAI
ncbi:hypothetical protein Lsai_1919 [Legionella sainthelensi]|uniref:Uncharacterized protein n=1 Tax=Legionella sainthelensi TaxID=28087 RepID=A0A0W0YK01_9GAMM|nr:hypothetical protein [Legionella sainthelensi]KTD56942.1 hypothetical protein Lsai_1919 [Legionella sainthelensi]VEH37196.1 Uncharacterised protein [Legionella sainthelensi]